LDGSHLETPVADGHCGTNVFPKGFSMKFFANETWELVKKIFEAFPKIAKQLTQGTKTVLDLWRSLSPVARKRLAITASIVGLMALGSVATTALRNLSDRVKIAEEEFEDVAGQNANLRLTIERLRPQFLAQAAKERVREVHEAARANNPARLQKGIREVKQNAMIAIPELTKVLSNRLGWLEEMKARQFMSMAYVAVSEAEYFSDPRQLSRRKEIELSAVRAVEELAAVQQILEKVASRAATEPVVGVPLGFAADQEMVDWALMKARILLAIIDGSQARHGAAADAIERVASIYGAADDPHDYPLVVAYMLMESQKQSRSHATPDGGSGSGSGLSDGGGGGGPGGPAKVEGKSGPVIGDELRAKVADSGPGNGGGRKRTTPTPMEATREPMDRLTPTG
jgi:uncharacterized membrane protein YgcG